MIKSFQDILEISNSLQDSISRRVFWSRLQADADLVYREKTEMAGVKQLASIFNETNKKKTIER